MTETSVKKSVTVRASVAHAFAVFTQRFDLWWPRSHHISKTDMKEAIMEGKEGGRWYERGVDGSECEWGKVLVWAPPAPTDPPKEGGPRAAAHAKVALSWHISPTWSYDADPSHASRVEVTFHDNGDGTTRVELTHSELDRHGKGWEELVNGVSGNGGWSDLLDIYRKSAEAS